MEEKAGEAPGRGAGAPEPGGDRTRTGRRQTRIDQGRMRVGRGRAKTGREQVGNRLQAAGGSGPAGPFRARTGFAVSPIRSPALVFSKGFLTFVWPKAGTN